MILCQNLNFPLSVCNVSLELEMMFGDVLE